MGLRFKDKRIKIEEILGARSIIDALEIGQ